MVVVYYFLLIFCLISFASLKRLLDVYKRQVLMDALYHLQELILDGKSVRLSDLGLFSIGMSSKAEDTNCLLYTSSSCLVRDKRGCKEIEFLKIV